MTPEIITCFVVCVITFALYLWNPYKSLGTTAVISILLFYTFKCVDASVLTSCFGNTTGLLTCAMFVVAAGFNKTQFVRKLASGVNRISKGSLQKVMIGYIAMAVLLGQFISSNLIPFCILYPLLKATVEEMDVSPSKVMFPLGITCIICVNVLPIGGGAATYATMNAVMETNGAAATMEILDPMIGRLPLLVVTYIYCAFFASKFCPDKPVVALRDIDTSAADRAIKVAELPKFQETAATVIFFAVTVALIFCKQLGMANWQVAMFGAVAMVLTGVLNKKEATNALPIWVYLVFVGGLVMANALNLTGAGALVGDFVAGIAGSGKSNLMFYAVFFFGPYILTQFILNQTAMNIFYPIAIQTCIALGVSPVGAMICVQAAGLSAFLTPMATGTVPYMMGAGGYDIKTLLKMGIIPFILCTVTAIVWMSIAFPVF